MNRSNFRSMKHNPGYFYMVAIPFILIALGCSGHAKDNPEDTGWSNSSENTSLVDCRELTQEEIRRMEEAETRVALEDKMTTIIFDFDKSTLNPEQKKQLDLNIALLKKIKDITIIVEGHTDARGDNEYNFTLAMARALTVEKYMVKHGMADDKISSVSYGEEKPFFKGQYNRASQSQLRRVEFTVW